MIASILNESRSLPVNNASHRVVLWHVFRAASAAVEYAEGIKLGEEQSIVGGMDFDSIGNLWWVGVEVEEVSRWGNLAAVNKHAE